MTKIKAIFVIVSVLFVTGVFTGAYFSDSVDVSGNTFSAGVSSSSDIIINEMIPDPVGFDNAPMPNGEWIELYNTGSWDIDVAGWKVIDDDNDQIIISSGNTSGGTIVLSKKYLVVYRDSDGSFNLDNDNDNIRLVKDSVDIDSFSYSFVNGNESWARVPNAGLAWTTQSSTKGVKND